MSSKNILDRFRDGDFVIGDGGFVIEMEKRGYVKAGPWTPEAVVTQPEAVKQLHREFLQAGADIVQAFTFYASDDKLSFLGNTAGKDYGCKSINSAACKLAREVANEKPGALVAAGVTQTPSYQAGDGKKATQQILRDQLQTFKNEGVDFVICEYFANIEEMEWAIEVAKETKLPVCSTMCIGLEGDLKGNSLSDCAVRMAKAGADVIGVNCHYDPFITMKSMGIIKETVAKNNLEVYLMCQPLGFMTADCDRRGYIALPEFPYALEPRLCTRMDMRRYARLAKDLGIHYIGGCCGFQPYHIRAMSNELRKSEDSIENREWVESMKMNMYQWNREKCTTDFWMNLIPATGRPCSSSFCKLPPDQH